MSGGILGLVNSNRLALKMGSNQIETGLANHIFGSISNRPYFESSHIGDSGTDRKLSASVSRGLWGWL